MGGHNEEKKNFWIIGIDEGKELQVNNIDQFDNKIIEENVPKLRKDTTPRYKKYTEHQIDKTIKENSHIISELNTNYL